MAAKVVWYRDAWWLRVHHKGKKKDRRLGPTKADQRQAEEIARKVNAAIALGQYGAAKERQAALPCDAELQRWLTSYAPTMKPSYEESVRGLICNHLVPYFGDKDLRNIREADLLSFTRSKLDAGLAPLTIRNARLTGEFIPFTTGGGINFFIGSNENANGYYAVPAYRNESLGAPPNAS